MSVVIFALGFLAGTITGIGAVALGNRVRLADYVSDHVLPWEKATIIQGEEVRDISALSQLNDSEKDLTIDDIYGTDRR